VEPERALEVAVQVALVGEAGRGADLRLDGKGSLVDDTFHHDRRGQALHTGQGCELLVPQGLVGSEIRGGDAEEVVRISEEPLRVAHLGDVGQPALKIRDRHCVLSIHRHVHEHLEAETERGGIDDCSISARAAVGGKERRSA
jgi:hypothetical protein